MIGHRCAAIGLLFSGMLIGAASFAGDENGDLTRKVDQVFSAYDKAEPPRCALGAIRDGNFIYRRGYGLASLELGVPLTPHSRAWYGRPNRVPIAR
jgi:CubicO group peptidase (beta-lactamase class C family)